MTDATNATGASSTTGPTGARSGLDAASVEALRRDYRAAFLRYLPRRDEAALDRGYRLGRDAVARGLSMLELAQVHHDILVEVLQDSAADEHPATAASASEFFLEVLATYDMTQRVLRAGDSGRGAPCGRGGDVS